MVLLHSNAHLKLVLVALVLALGAASLGASPAAASDTRCGDAVPRDRPLDATPLTGIYENIVVPSGLTCILWGAEVRGNALALPGSKLLIFPGSTIHGNVEAKEGAHVNAFGSTVGGNYTCDHCLLLDAFGDRIGGNLEVVGVELGSFIGFNEIGGNVNVLEGLAPDSTDPQFPFGYDIQGNAIAGNFTYEKNRGTPGILGNAIDGQLIVAENVIGTVEAEITTNEVGGNLRVLKNRGALNVTDNVINDGLECHGNAPAVTSLGNVAERFGGECAA